MATTETNYWIVGAAQGGSDDHYDDFIRDCCWKLFWTKEEKRNQYEKVLRIRPGDRIAMKKNVGGRSGKSAFVPPALLKVEAVLAQRFESNGF